MKTIYPKEIPCTIDHNINVINIIEAMLAMMKDIAKFKQLTSHLTQTL